MDSLIRKSVEALTFVAVAAGVGAKRFNPFFPGATAGGLLLQGVVTGARLGSPIANAIRRLKKLLPYPLHRLAPTSSRKP
ncbi:MAG: hypothetical protein AAGE99_03205 [Chlamydiota bacterium]